MRTSSFTSICAFCIVVLLTACAHSGGSHAAANAAPTSASAWRGAGLFTTQCASCHGVHGAGGRLGPSLRAERKRKTSQAVRAIIVDPDPPMPKLYPAQLTAQDVDDLTAYVETL